MDESKRGDGQEGASGQLAEGAGTQVAAPLQPSAFVVEIPLNRLERNPQQPRLEFPDTELQELAVSLAQHGVLQPLIVVRKPLEPGEPERFEIVAGERRWRAAPMAGLATVPCLVHTELSGRARLEISLVENLQRKDLNPIEEALAFRRLHDEFGLTHDDIARRLGRARPSVSNTLRLLDLPSGMQEALRKGIIRFGEARALLSVLDPLQRQAVFERMVKGEVSARVVERMRRGKKTPRVKTVGDPELFGYESELAKTLGAPVRIKPLGPGGVIEVDYFSTEELVSIVRKISDEEERLAGS